MKKPLILIFFGILSISIGCNIILYERITKQNQTIEEVKNILLEKREQKRKEYMDKIIEHILESYNRKCII
jgi:hypothetical protein